MASSANRGHASGCAMASCATHARKRCSREPRVRAVATRVRPGPPAATYLQLVHREGTDVQMWRQHAHQQRQLHHVRVGAQGGGVGCAEKRREARGVSRMPVRPYQAPQAITASFTWIAGAQATVGLPQTGDRPTRSRENGPLTCSAVWSPISPTIRMTRVHGWKFARDGRVHRMKLDFAPRGCCGRHDTPATLSYRHLTRKTCIHPDCWRG